MTNERKVIKEVKIGETTYKIGEIGFLDLFDLLEAETKKDKIANLIIASVIEPKLTKETITMDIKEGIELLQAINEVNNLDKLKSNLPNGVELPNY